MATANLKIQKTQSDKNKYARYEILPLTKGFGHTLGTPIRRVLLSSIRGSSIVKVKIKGIDHELSTLKGMKEDVLRFISNLTTVVFKVDASEEEKISIKVHGKKQVIASDIKVPGNVEIINPDTYLCELTDDKAQLEVEAVLQTGYGFHVVDNEIRNTEPGTIPLNKNFSPIDKVNLNVVSTRVGQSTDHEKIILEVWGNGGVDLDEAIKMALQTLLDKTTEVNEVAGEIEEAKDSKSKAEEPEEISE